MIRAYPKESSVAPGDELVLCVSTDAPAFSVAFYRQGTTLRQSEIPAARFSGRIAPPREAWVDFAWPEYAISIPADCPTGVYVALFSGGEGSFPHELPTESYFSSHAALFVVRPHPDATRTDAERPLYRIPIFTYHAYHAADSSLGFNDATLYTGAAAVSLRRPGGGVGAVPWDAFNVDVYDTQTPRQTFAHWDAKFIAWACARGIELDYCTDLDLHRYGIALLERYALAISAGHDEYWSDSMYSAQETFVARGGNLAYFGANTAWWRIEIQSETTIARAGRFDREERLIGVTFSEGGGRWARGRPAAGYRVCDAAHWTFAGTGVSDGEIFGADQRLVGYECDGRSEHSPQSFITLASCDVSDWQQADPAAGELYGAMHAAMGVYAACGLVFNAGTTDWPRLLGLDRIVDRITRNVIARLGPGAPRSAFIAYGGKERAEEACVDR